MIMRILDRIQKRVLYKLNMDNKLNICSIDNFIIYLKNKIDIY